jgi:GTP pyrophosphokinase
VDTRDEVTVGTAQPPARRGGRIPLPRRRRADRQPTGFDALQKKVRSYNPKGDLKGLESAYQVAVEAHEGQLRLSGEPFIEHPLAVALILADLRLDTTTLEAGLLHDTVEDTEVTLDRIRTEFGEDVADIVDGLTKLDKLQFQTRELAQAENVRKMIVAMAGDIRVLLIKLADRLHNMRTVGALSSGKQRRMATETLEIYAPLANRLGVQEVKWELEDLAFKTLHPGPYKEIAQLVETRRDERTLRIRDLTDTLRQKLKELGIKADVDGRPKHLYSIYEKMVIRGKDFEEIFDLVGIRIQVESMRTATGRSAPCIRFGSPSPAGSRTTSRCPSRTCTSRCTRRWSGPRGRPIEIQIRTRDMHRTAQYGIAAHWRYKEGQAGRGRPRWLGQMMEWLKDMADPREFMEGCGSTCRGPRLRVHPEGRRHEPAAGRHARRLRLHDPHRGRATARSAPR